MLFLNNSRSKSSYRLQSRYANFYCHRHSAALRRNFRVKPIQCLYSFVLFLKLNDPVTIIIINDSDHVSSDWL